MSEAVKWLGPLQSAFTVRASFQCIPETKLIEYCTGRYHARWRRYEHNATIP